MDENYKDKNDEVVSAEKPSQSQQPIATEQQAGNNVGLEAKTNNHSGDPKKPLLIALITGLIIIGVALLVSAYFKLYLPHKADQARRDSQVAYSQVEDTIQSDMRDIPKVDNHTILPKIYHSCYSIKEEDLSWGQEPPLSDTFPRYGNQCVVGVIWQTKLGDDGIQQAQKILKTLYSKDWRVKDETSPVTYYDSGLDKMVYVDGDTNFPSLDNQLKLMNLHEDGSGGYTAYWQTIEGSHKYDHIKYVGIPSYIDTGDRFGSIRYKIGFYSSVGPNNKNRSYTFKITEHFMYYQSTTFMRHAFSTDYPDPIKDMHYNEIFSGSE